MCESVRLSVLLMRSCIYLTSNGSLKPTIFVYHHLKWSNKSINYFLLPIDKTRESNFWDWFYSNNRRLFKRYINPLNTFIMIINDDYLFKRYINALNSFIMIIIDDYLFKRIINHLNPFIIIIIIDVYCFFKHIINPLNSFIIIIIIMDDYWLFKRYINTLNPFIMIIMDDYCLFKRYINPLHSYVKTWYHFLSQELHFHMKVIKYNHGVDKIDI